MSQISEDTRNYCVYVHKTPNGKRYVGITGRPPEERWGRNGRCYKRHIFYNAILKYGWENIEHEILESNLTMQEAMQKESKYIALFESNKHKHGYNQTPGGHMNGSCSQETKDKLSRAMTGRVSAFKGHKHTEDVRKILSEQKCGEKSPRWGKFGKESPCSKEIDQYDVHRNFIKTWYGAREVERELGITWTVITNTCLYGVPHSAAGYYWSYHGDVPKWDYDKNTSPVAQIDLKTNKILGVFCSITDAGKQTGYSRNQIAASCKGNVRKPYKYKWAYIDAFTVAGHIIDKQTFQEVGVAEAVNLLILPEILNKQNELKGE